MREKAKGRYRFADVEAFNCSSVEAFSPLVISASSFLRHTTFQLRHFLSPRGTISPVRLWIFAARSVYRFTAYRPTRLTASAHWNHRRSLVRFDFRSR